MLDDISTGASNDIERATNIARSMVTKYGFSEKLGPIVYGKDEGEIFLGRDLNQTRNYSETVATEIDEEIRDLVEAGYAEARRILTEHMDQLTLVAEQLIVSEKIEADDFESLMTAGKLAPKRMTLQKSDPAGGAAPSDQSGNADGAGAVSKEGSETPAQENNEKES